MNNTPDQNKTPLGIIVSGHYIETWIEQSVKEISGSEQFQIGAILSLGQRNPFLRRIQSFLHPKNLLITLFHFMDRLYFRIPESALIRRNIREFLSAVNEPLYIRSDSLDSLPELLNKIQDQQQIKLWISYSYNRLPDNVFSQPSNVKCLFYEFSRHAFMGIDELGLGELANAEGEIRSTLVMRTVKGSYDVFSTSSMTDIFSQQLTLNNHLWKLCYYIPQLLPGIMAGSYQENSHKLKEEQATDENGNLKSVTGSKMFVHIKNKLKDSIQKRISEEQWILLYSPNNWSETIKSPEQIRTFDPPSGKFWADPFIVNKNDLNYIFFEEYEHKTGKGHISHFVCDKDGNVQNSGKVLERPYHLAYPYIFEYRGQLYMIPDSSENHTIELYRCTRFPDQWQFVKTIMEDVIANDTSLLQKDDMIWLFTCMARKEVRWNYDDLYLFYSTDLFSDLWTPHRMNPVISDVRRARPAGRIFEHDGDLYRPSQDCSHRYGKALNINRIEVLNKEVYAETCLYQIDSAMMPHLNKIHTLNSVDGFTIMDGSIIR